jgi:hypothetical protein
MHTNSGMVHSIYHPSAPSPVTSQLSRPWWTWLDAVEHLPKLQQPVEQNGHRHVFFDGGRCSSSHYGIYTARRVRVALYTSKHNYERIITKRPLYNMGIFFVGYRRARVPFMPAVRMG